MSKITAKKGRPSKKNELSDIKPETIQLKYETALEKGIKTHLSDATIKTFHDSFIKQLPPSITKNLSKPFERIVIHELLYRYTNIVSKLTFKGIRALAKEASKRATQYIESNPQSNRPLHKRIVDGVAYGQVDHSALKKKPPLELLPEVKFTLKNGGLPYQFNVVSALEITNRRVDKYGELRDLQKLYQIVERNLQYKAVLAAKRVANENAKKENRPAKESAIVTPIIKEQQEKINTQHSTSEESKLWAKKENEYKQEVKQILANHRHQSHQEKLAQQVHLLKQEDLTIRLSVFLMLYIVFKSLKVAALQRRSPTKVYEEIRKQKTEERKMLFVERIKRERDQHRVFQTTR